MDFNLPAYEYRLHYVSLSQCENIAVKGNCEQMIISSVFLVNSLLLWQMEIEDNVQTAHSHGLNRPCQHAPINRHFWY